MASYGFTIGIGGSPISTGATVTAALPSGYNSWQFTGLGAVSYGGVRYNVVASVGTTTFSFSWPGPNLTGAEKITVELALVDSAVSLTALPAATWSDPTSSRNYTFFADVEIQVVGTPGVAYTPQRSLDGTNFVACNAYDKDGNTVTSISTAGIYRLPGNGYLKLTGGSGSTVLVRAGS